MDAQKLSGVVKDSLLRALRRPGPLSVAEVRQLRVLLAYTDIARNEIALLEGNVEARFFRELQHEHFLNRVTPRNALHTLVAGDSVFQVDNQFAVDEFAEINLCPAMD